MLVACWQSVCGLQSCLQQEGGNSATSIFRTNCQPQQLLFAVGCSGLISSVCQHTQAEEQSVLVHSDQQFGVGLLPIDIASVESQMAYIKAEGEKWGALVRAAKITGE